MRKIRSARLGLLCLVALTVHAQEVPRRLAEEILFITAKAPVACDTGTEAEQISCLIAARYAKDPLAVKVATASTMTRTAGASSSFGAAASIGFSLKEIRDLSGLTRGHSLTCGEVKALTEKHVADIRAKIRDLRKLDRVLTDLSAKCRGTTVPDCPILDALGSSEFSSTARSTHP